MMSEQEKNELTEEEREKLEQSEKIILSLLGVKTVQDALAQSIEDLTNEQKRKLMSLLFPFEEEVLALFYDIAEDFADYGLDWLADYCDNLLDLRCSLQGFRSKQIENIAAQKAKEKAGIGFFSRLFRREKEKEPPLGEVELSE